MDFWSDAARPAVRGVTVDGVELRAGSRVRLRPHAGRDVLDLALAGRTARIAALEQELDGLTHVAVTLDDDPGRDLGEGRYPGHRFFFAPDELEPLDAGDADAGPAPRILVAGIGNIFLGDDGFGPAMARRLAARPWPRGVDVRDFGIRGLDLAYALAGYDHAVLVDAVPRGGAPGTLYVIEPTLEADAAAVPEAHGMDPVKVLHLARALGGTPPHTLIVGCEPEPLPPDLDPTTIVGELSPPILAALAPAQALVESLIAELRDAADMMDTPVERR
jgi:hydrogenase maturation protease